MSSVNRHTIPHLDCTGPEWIVGRVAQFRDLPESELVEEIVAIDRLIREMESRSNKTGIEYAKKYRESLMQVRRG
jgi:hypothetical protein